MSPTITKRRLCGPFSKDEREGCGMRLVGKSEINVVIGNTLSEGFLVVIVVQGARTSLSGEGVFVQSCRCPRYLTVAFQIG
jgi:hypothetical protein